MPRVTRSHVPSESYAPGLASRSPAAQPGARTDENGDRNERLTKEVLGRGTDDRRTRIMIVLSGELRVTVRGCTRVLQSGSVVAAEAVDLS